MTLTEPIRRVKEDDFSNPLKKVKGRRYVHWLSVILGLDRTAGLTFGTKTACTHYDIGDE